jgi:hypothetical protein
MFKIFALLPLILISTAHAQSEDSATEYKKCVGELKLYAEYIPIFSDLEKECRGYKMTGDGNADKATLQPFAAKLFATYKDMEDKTKSYADKVSIDSSWTKDQLEAKARECGHQNLDAYMPYMKARDSVKACIADKGVETLDKVTELHPEFKVVMERARCLTTKEAKTDFLQFLKDAQKRCVESQGFGVPSSTLKAEFADDLKSQNDVMNAQRSEKIMSFVQGVTETQAAAYPAELKQCQADVKTLETQITTAQAKLNSCTSNRPVARRQSTSGSTHKAGRSTPGATGSSKAKADAPKATN